MELLRVVGQSVAQTIKVATQFSGTGHYVSQSVMSQPAEDTFEFVQFSGRGGHKAKQNKKKVKGRAAKRAAKKAEEAKTKKSNDS